MYIKCDNDFVNTLKCISTIFYCREYLTKHFFYGSTALVDLGLLLADVSRTLKHTTLGRTPLG